MGLFSSSGAPQAAEQASNQQLLSQFNITEQNLRPTVRAGQQQLPGIERQLDPTQFGEVLGSLRGGLNRFLDPTRARRGEVGGEQLRLAGLDPSRGAISDLSAIDPSTFADLLLGAEQDLFANRFALSGLGQAAGTSLSELGQRTGGTIAQNAAQRQQQEQRESAATTENLIKVAGLALAFSDERLKDDIKELGCFKGLRIISWKWKECVPESWRDIEIGFSAQDVLSKFPEFVQKINGFLAIDRNGLMKHLGVI